MHIRMKSLLNWVERLKLGSLPSQKLNYCKNIYLHMIMEREISNSETVSKVKEKTYTFELLYGIL